MILFSLLDTTMFFWLKMLYLIDGILCVFYNVVYVIDRICYYFKNSIIYLSNRKFKMTIKTRYKQL